MNSRFSPEQEKGNHRRKAPARMRPAKLRMKIWPGESW